MVGGGLSPEKVSEQLTARGPVPRTVASVRIRINKLGRSTRDGWMSGEELIRQLGVYRARVSWFEAQGLLTRAQWGRWRRYAIVEVEALIASQAGLTIDPRRVKDARLRSLAETAAIVNRRRMTG